ncbi:hypothetical protein OAP39_03405 [Flavobacteriaceae bacterium]|nr:hypothetical protein [Flavobacteriaceae bacterium]
MKITSFAPIILLFIFVLSFNACKKDDEGEEVELRDHTEQELTDEQLLLAFLQTHTYNYEDFPPANEEHVAIIIDSLAGDLANKTPLIDLVQSIEVPVNTANDIAVNHTLYHLVARQGDRLESKPSIVDSVYLSYTGKLLDGTQFDQMINPIWFDNTRVIRGFSYGLQNFAPGTFEQSQNGTINFSGYGQGLIFMPSGLGYFASSQGQIPAYSPLMFEVSVYTTNQSDHDGDGILSINEDPDGDGNPYNDDTDQDGTPNFLDSDDDGDGILTINEYDNDQDGQADDDDNDGTPNYLDNN